MALKFLNKKGWHTGSLRNIENVWKAEQKHAAEQKKLEELRLQIQQERERSEFRALQEQAGLVPKQERLDFLYESGLAVGKGASSSSGGVGVAFKELEQPTKADNSNNNNQQSSVPGALFEDKQYSANDAWRKLHSDPLLQIRQREQEALARLKNNPVKMAFIRKSVEGKKAKKKDGSKKERKKKRRKHASSESHSDSEEDGAEENSRKRSNDLETLRNYVQRHGKSQMDSDDDDLGKRESRRDIRRKEKHRQESPQKMHRQRSPGRYSEWRNDRENEDGGERNHHEPYDRRENHDKLDGRRRERHQPDERRRERDQAEERWQERYERDERRRDHDERDERRRDHHERDERRRDHHERDEIRRDCNERDARRRNLDKPGPDGRMQNPDGRPRGQDEANGRMRNPDEVDGRTRTHEVLDHEKYTSKGRIHSESGTRHEPASRPRRRNVALKLTEEERAAKLREMQVDAELHEEQRWKRLKRAEDDDAQEAKRNENVAFGGKNFLDAAQKSVYGAEKGGSATIEESVRRRTHYAQRGSEAEGHAFRR